MKYLKKMSPSHMFLASMALIFLAGMLFKKTNYISALETKSWPKTIAVITQSEIQGRNTQSIHAYFEIYISYSYQVNRVNYEGNTLFKGGENMSLKQEASARLIVNEFPVGKTVPVYYSPKNPQDSVLKKGLTKHNRIQLLLASLTMLIALYLLFAFFKKLSPNKS
ncbi:MAG: DUF3592 domain-containing protein [Bdellovibrionaceae bacterium]|nr:DUF3592 domain-containing protein [Pseudobdellovibrionaceae bacterium]